MDPRKECYLETRGDINFIMLIMADGQHHEMAVLLANGITIGKWSYQRSYEHVVTTFYREVGKIHTGYYDDIVIPDKMNHVQKMGLTPDTCLKTNVGVDHEC